MLKASSLIYTITIVFLTGILASSFLLYHQLSQKEIDRYLLQFRLSKNAHSGIQYLLAAGDYIDYDTPKIITLTDDPADSIEICKKSWGIFDIGISRSHFKNQQAEKIGLIGSKLLGDEKNGLYVADLDWAISLCGKTMLDGVTYLPGLGVKRAYIEGENYVGEKLVYGTQRKSSRDIPELNPELVKQNLDRIKGKTVYTDSIIDFDGLEKDTIVHPFQEKTLVLKKQGRLVLNSGQYSGNIIFMSSTEIVVEENCRLQNVLLFAPEITIESKDSSFFQAFATDTLIVKEESVLWYPTVLGVIKDDQKAAAEPLLLIEKKSIIGGSIWVYDLKPDHQHYPALEIREESKIFGEVYSNGKASLQGSIFGAAIIFKLYLKTPSSGYENHLLHSVIDGTKVPPGFCGMPLKDKRYGKTILQWL